MLINQPDDVADAIVSGIENDVGLSFTQASDAQMARLEEAAGRPLPPLWESLCRRAADLDRAGPITSCGWFTQAPESLHWLTKTQASISRAAASSNSEYSESGAILLRLCDDVPVVTIGSGDNPSVVRAEAWPNEAQLDEPALLSLRLGDWLQRVHVRPTVRKLAKLLDRESVLAVGPAAIPFHELLHAISGLVGRLDIGSNDPLQVDVYERPENRSTRCIKRALYRDLVVNVDEDERVDTRTLALAGHRLQGVNAALAQLIIVVAAGAVASTPTDDAFGILDRGPNTRLSPNDATRALVELLEVGDFDDVLSTLRSRIETIGDSFPA